MLLKFGFFSYTKLLERWYYQGTDRTEENSEKT